MSRKIPISHLPPFFHRESRCLGSSLLRGKLSSTFPVQLPVLVPLQVATGRSYTRMGRIFYDALGQRVVFEEEIRSDGPETTAYNEYLFYKEV